MSRRRAAALVAAAGVAAAGAGVWMVASSGRSEGSYRDLASRTGLAEVREREAGDEPSMRDWDAIWADNPATCAWLSVAGTPIDYPVVSCADASQESWYLRHDLWGEWSMEGTPFMDHRCGGAEARNVVAYGHHMTSSEAMFSVLQRAYEQEVFDGLGELVWDTPARVSRMRPLFAVTVAQDWPDIQRFDWAGASGGDYSSWLASMCAAADAVAQNREGLAGTATRSVALVTCSSDWSFQPWRTVCLWCM